MPNEIKCPNCGAEFEPNESIRKSIEEQVRKETNVRAEEWKKNKEKELEVSLRKNISSDFETQLRLLKESNNDNEEKLKQARQKEVDYLRKEQELKNKEAELDIQLQKMLLEERGRLSEIIRKEETEKNLLKDTENKLKIIELEKKNEDTNKLLNEARRKNEQGSMQMQGEVQERWLFDTLKIAFPFDLIEDISTGKKGADIIMTVRNNIGTECGKVYFESKRTKDWSNIWIEKLKQDMRNIGADIGVIVTQALPKEIEKFGEKDGIYVSTLTEASSLAMVLRNAIIKVFEVRKSQENKGDKMVALYDYLTSHEFVDNWNALRDRFRKLKAMLQKEKENFEINWKRKEKLINLIIDGSAHITGSIQGISGQDTIDLNLLEERAEDEEE